jgi:hypothetical protein
MKSFFEEMADIYRLAGFWMLSFGALFIIPTTALARTYKVDGKIFFKVVLCVLVYIVAIYISSFVCKGVSKLIK